MKYTKSPSPFSLLTDALAIVVIGVFLVNELMEPEERKAAKRKAKDTVADLTARLKECLKKDCPVAYREAARLRDRIVNLTGKAPEL